MSVQTSLAPFAAPSAAPRVPAAASVRAELQFIRPQREKPSIRSAALTGGAPQYLFDSERRTVEIADMRPLVGQLSLDREGFALVRSPSRVTDFYDDRQVAGLYHAEVEALVRAETGARKVIVFDVTRRSSGAEGAANADGRRKPAGRVHVDYTTVSGPQRTRDLLGEAEAERLTQAGTRVLQVNVWRPIRGPVRRSPLALADAASVRPEELLATDHIFPDRVGEIYHLAYGPEQRWYYAPEMTPDEALLIKGWDSLDDGRARFTPHSAFELPDTDETAPARESVEVRTLAVF
jgi:hypothetical protein